MHCTFQFIETMWTIDRQHCRQRFVCPTCERSLVVKTEVIPRRECSGPPPEPREPQTPTEKVLASLPKRPANEINRLLGEFCRTCEHFNAAEIKCALCGCNLRGKLNLAAAVCPAGKFGAYDSNLAQGMP